MNDKNCKVRIGAFPNLGVNFRPAAGLGWLMAANKITGTCLIMALASGVLGCGGGSSAGVMQPPPPDDTVSVSPTLVVVPRLGSQQFTATVSNDSSGSGVSWTLLQNGSMCSPACGTISPAQTASGAPAIFTAPAAEPANPQVKVTARSVANTRRSASAVIGVTLANPVPFINQPLVPGAVAPGGAAFTLTVNGTGFVAGSVVNWNGSARNTTFVNAAQLQAEISASDITTAATAEVTVLTPTPGGGTSNISFLQVTTPATPAVAIASYGTGNASYGIVVADFRGIGKLDLAASGYDTASVGVLLGNGDGTFQPQVNYNVGGYPQGLAQGDFNGDGKPDLVTLSTGPPPTSNALSVLLGNGDGTFQAPVNYTTGGYPFAVAVADLNRDGHLDLAVANYYDSTVSIFVGNGDGTFQPQVVYSCGCPLLPGSIALGDFNGDGILDMVTTDSYGVYVQFGNGDGSFQPPVAYNSQELGYASVIVADFNGDGKLDFATGVKKGVSILLGNGDGTFQGPVTYPFGQAPGAILAGDFNGDGKLDLAAADYFDEAYILLGNGDGTFQAPLTFGIGGYDFNTASGDFNGDGRLDLAVDALDYVWVLLQTSPNK